MIRMLWGVFDVATTIPNAKEKNTHIHTHTRTRTHAFTQTNNTKHVSGKAPHMVRQVLLDNAVVFLRAPLLLFGRRATYSRNDCKLC